MKDLFKEIRIKKLRDQLLTATGDALTNIESELASLTVVKEAAQQQKNIAPETKAYLEGELTEIITGFADNVTNNISNIDRNFDAYEIAQAQIIDKVNAIEDDALSLDDKEKLCDNVMLLFQNIVSIKENREEIYKIEHNLTHGKDPNEEKKRLEGLIESSKAIIKNIPNDFKSTINKIVSRRVLLRDSSPGVSVFDSLLAESQVAADEALYEKGAFDETDDIARFSPKDIKALTKKIQGLDAYTCRVVLNNSIRRGNIPLAYELTKKLLSFKLEEDKEANLYKNLLIKGIEVFNNVEIDADDPRKIFMRSNAKEFVKHLGRDTLLAIQNNLKEHSRDKPEFLKRLLSERLNFLPRTYNSSDFKLEGKIELQRAVDLDRIIEECIVIKQLEKDLIERHNQRFSARNYINNIYKYYYASSKAMSVSKDELERASQAIMYGNLKASAQVDGEETKSMEPDSADQIKDKIKAALRRIGIKESELNKEDLFCVIERIASVNHQKNKGFEGEDYGSDSSRTSSPNAFSGSDRERVNPGARVDSTGRNTSFTNQTRHRLKRVNAGNAWHVAAASNKAVKRLQEVRIGKDQIAMQDRNGNTAIHALFSNKLIDAGALKDAAEILFSNYIEDKGSEYLKQLVNTRNADGDTALHLLCKNPNINDEELAELLVILRKNGADLTIADHADQTALHIICSRKGEIPAVEYLTSSNLGENKPDLNAKDSLGYTAMYLAAKHFNMEVYNHLLVNAKADRYIRRDDNKEIDEILEDGYPNTAQAFIETYGQNKDSLRKQKQNIENGELENLKTAILADPNIIHILDENGDALLHHAVRKANIDMVKFLVEKGANILLPNSARDTPLDLAGNKIMIEALFKGDKAIKKYRETQDDNLKEKSYYSGVVAAAGAAITGSHIINYPKDLGSLLAAGVTSLGIAAAAGAAVWGAGRLGHECWTQYKEGGDANISDSYYMASNFSKSWKELQELESDSGLSGEKLDYLKELEEKIVKETKKNSPDILEMGEGLLKANLLRRSLFKGQENIEALSDKGEELVGHFNKWKEVQKGRDVSEGLKIFYDAVTTSASAVAAGGVAIMLSDSKFAIGASAVVGIGASWVNRIRNSGVKEVRKAQQH